MHNIFHSILIIFILLFSGTLLYAQQPRIINLEATLNLPTSDATVYSGDIIHTQMAVANNGPDTLVAGDTILFRYQYTATEGGGSQTNVSLLTLSQSLLPGQTPLLINADIPFSNGTAYPVLHLNFCVHLFDPNTEPVMYTGSDDTPIRVSYNDPDTTNNTGCTSIIIENKETGIAHSDIQSVEQLKLYPNPACDVVNFQPPLSPSGNLKVAIRDITGREISQKEYKVQNNQPIALPITLLPDGIYFIEVQTAYKRTSGKLIVQKY